MVIKHTLVFLHKVISSCFTIKLLLVDLHAQSTHKMGLYWALLGKAIYSAASKSSLVTFVQFYMLDVSRLCVATAVLES